MQDKLSDDLLENYMHNFWGYGNLSADYWFIGMEEGGVQNFEELIERVNTWVKLGQLTVQDIQDSHRAIGAGDYFGRQKGRPKYQPTWERLIRIILSCKHHGATSFGIDEIRNYQATALGRKDAETCLMEILPLPAKGAKHWIYKDKTGIPYLSDRSSYSKELFPLRVERLRDMISEKRPKSVVCYGGGKGYYPKWCEVAGKTLKLKQFMGQQVAFDHVKGVTFALVPHPNSRGLTNEFLNNFGSELARRVKT